MVQMEMIEYHVAIKINVFKTTYFLMGECSYNIKLKKKKKTKTWDMIPHEQNAQWVLFPLRCHVTSAVEAPDFGNTAESHQHILLL